MPKSKGMQQQRVFRFIYPIAILFLIVNVLTLTTPAVFERWKADHFVVMGGNLVLFAATLLSFIIFSKSFQSENPNVFGRSIYASFLIRFFSCAVAAAVYILVNKKQVNKPGLIICMALYIIYTFLEVRVLTRMLKTKKNA